MKYGTLFSYWSRDWDCDAAGYAALIGKVASIGFDVLEVSAHHLHGMADADLRRLRDLAGAHGLVFTTNSGPGREYDLAAEDGATRRAGIRYFETIMEKMTVLGSRSLAGAIYSFWPCDFDRTDKDGAWERSVASLREVARTAERLGIVIALEVLNRNETYILTTAAEAVRYCERVGSDAVRILLDTYHMNIEEDDLAAAIRTAGARLAHVHVGENNRKLPGMNGSIDWDGVGAALRGIGYDGTVVMEPFLLSGGAVGRSIRLWRDLSGNADAAEMDRLIGDSLRFLRRSFEPAGDAAT